MKYMMDTDDLANKLKAFSFLAVVVKVCVCRRETSARNRKT